MRRIRVGIYTCACILILAACSLGTNPGSTTGPPNAGTSNPALGTLPSVEMAGIMLDAAQIEFGIENPFGRAVSFEELDSAFGPPVNIETYVVQADDLAMTRDYVDATVDVYIGSDGSTMGGITKVQIRNGSIGLSPDFSISIGASLDEVLAGIKNEGNSITEDDYHGRVQVLYGTILHMNDCGFVLYQDETPTAIRLTNEGLLLEISLDDTQNVSIITFISEA